MSRDACEIAQSGFPVPLSRLFAAREPLKPEDGFDAVSGREVVMVPVLSDDLRSRVLPAPEGGCQPGQRRRLLDRPQPPVR